MLSLRRKRAYGYFPDRRLKNVAPAAFPCITIFQTSVGMAFTATQLKKDLKNSVN
jgi:hypothetical protein